MTEKQRLHTLVDDLPDSEIRTARRFLEYLRQEASDPVARALENAPYDDEPLSSEDLEEIEAAEKDWREGNVVPYREDDSFKVRRPTPDAPRLQDVTLPPPLELDVDIVDLLLEERQVKG